MEMKLIRLGERTTFDLLPTNLELTVNGQSFKLALDKNSPTGSMEYETIKLGCYPELDLAASLMTRLKAGEIFLDIGAHVGVFSTLAHSILARLGAGMVFSVEPEPLNFAFLWFNSMQNRTDSITWEIAQRCVSDENKEVQMYYNPHNDGGHSLFDVHRPITGERPDLKPFCRMFRAKARTLPGLLKECAWPKPNFVKIDAEGAETQILNTAGNSLDECHTLVLEANTPHLDGQGIKGTDFIAMLKQHGFHVWRQNPNLKLEPAESLIPGFWNLVCTRENTPFEFAL